MFGSAARSSRAGELAANFAEVERIYDKSGDNFAELFCRMFGFERLSESVSDALPDFVYDRGTGRLYSTKETK